MKAPQLPLMRTPWKAIALTAFGCVLIIANLLMPALAGQTAAKATTGQAAGSAAKARTFATAQEAATALIAAANQAVRLD